MPTVKGREGVARFFDQLPGELKKMTRGAARAGAKVIAADAKARCPSPEVAEAIKIKTKGSEGRMTATIGPRGGKPLLGKANWLEHGTTAHFISVDPEVSKGRSARSINRADKRANKDGKAGPGASLFINGQAVGKTVRHPGAERQSYLRPALDHNETEAIAAAQAFIDKRLKKLGIDPMEEDTSDAED